MSIALKTGGAPVKSVVLVHGGFVDGSGWEAVYYILKRDGYDVTIVQNPTTSLADDVAVTRRAIAAASGDVILVGHSYGGAVITDAGTEPKVAGSDKYKIRLTIRALRVEAARGGVATLDFDQEPGLPTPPWSATASIVLLFAKLLNPTLSAKTLGAKAAK